MPEDEQDRRRPRRRPGRSSGGPSIVWRSTCSRRPRGPRAGGAGRLPGVEDKIKRSSWRSGRATGPYSSAEYDGPVGGQRRSAACRVRHAAQADALRSISRWFGPRPRAFPRQAEPCRMGVLRNLESKLEGLVEGVFSRAFRARVQPVELARRLAKEMESYKTVSVSRTYVPNEYIVFLSREDRRAVRGLRAGARWTSCRPPARARGAREPRAADPAQGLVRDRPAAADGGVRDPGRGS